MIDGVAQEPDDVAANCRMMMRLNGRTSGPLARLTLLAALSACTLGPNFARPEPPPATGYTAPGEASASDVDAGVGTPRQTIVLGDKIAADWWTLLRSPALDGTVKEAIAGSPTIAGAKARLAEAQQVVVAANSALYPQVNFAASVSRQKISSATSGESPSAFPLPPNFNLFQIGPSVSYAVDAFGATRRQIEEQSALADYQGHQLDAAYLTLTGNAVLEALQIASLRAQVKAVDDILEIDRQNLDLVHKELQAGTVPESDVVIAESQLAADETLRPPLDQQLSAAKHALAVLLGRAPGEWAAPDFDMAALTLPDRLPVSLPSELAHQRPDILAAEAQLHAASAAIGVATAQLYPSITLSGSVGAAALDPGHLFNPAAFIWSIAAGLTQPVFDAGQREAERQAALAAFKAAAADYQQTVLVAFGQVADVLQALRNDARLLAAQQHARDTAAEAVRLQRVSFSVGNTGIINLLDAQRQYQQALLGYVRAEAQRYQDTAQLFVSMGGGGWEAGMQ
jgi:NodT family efflux transporter outer membrane factor (OMF) lipoprotein